MSNTPARRSLSRPAPEASHQPTRSGLIGPGPDKTCPPGNHHAYQSGVQPLGAVREPPVVHDFSQVKLHTDADTGPLAGRPHPHPKVDGHSGRAIQARLKVGPVTDPLEHEADRVADHLIQMADRGIAGATPHLSRKGDSRANGDGVVPSIVDEVVRSPGQPLDTAVRAYFEPLFGHDFSSVRIHIGEQAAESARAVGALAFTSGQHVVFGTEYGHDTEAKRKLLAHELAHTIQQSSGPRTAHSGTSLQRAPAGDPSTALPELGSSDPAVAPRYIDRLFQKVSPPSMLNGATTFFWEEGAAKKQITIALADLDQDDTRTFVALWKVHASKEEALKTVERYRKAAPGFAYYSFYVGKYGVIMPTSFSRGSTPNFHALWPDLKRLNAEAAGEIVKGLRQLGNAVNPIPCTELDENGELKPALNFSNCTLPLLLHAYSIHSATRGSRLPSESQARPVKTEPVKTEPVKTEPVKTEPVKTEPAKTEPVKTEPVKTEAEPVAVRTPAQLERHLEQLGLTPEEIRGLAGGRRRGQFGKARAALIERLLQHFTPEDLKALGKLLSENKFTLDEAAVHALTEGIAPGGMEDWIKRVSIAEAHGEATQLPSVEGAKEESLGKEQDPNARARVTKEKPSPGPEPRAFRRGNFAHRFAEYLLDAGRLPRPSKAEVVIELRDGTGDVIRADRIISGADRGELLEIKPAGRSADIGEAQLPGRLEALQREYPKKNGWTGRIVEYTPADVRAWLRGEAQAARAAGLPVPDVEGIMKLFGF